LVVLKPALDSTPSALELKQSIVFRLGAAEA
jgi:hypothetical protein